jgi:hypothetical protein
MEDHPKPTDWLTIVGVVDDVIQEGLRSSRDAAVYSPLAQLNSAFFLGHLNFVVRSSGEPDALMAAMRDAIHALDDDQPIASLGTMSNLISSTIAEPLFQVRLLTLFSACALLLAAIGIYGVLAYLVTERTREIGIRVAVGAVPSDVVRMVVRRTLALTVPGILIGLIASFGRHARVERPPLSGQANGSGDVHWRRLRACRRCARGVHRAGASGGARRSLDRASAGIGCHRFCFQQNYPKDLVPRSRSLASLGMTVRAGRRAIISLLVMQ